MAKKLNPDIIFGTDPDVDKMGVIVKGSAISAQMIAEMTLYYKSKWVSLYEGFVNIRIGFMVCSKTIWNWT